jgi:uncharacterized membrane protein YccC
MAFAALLAAINPVVGAVGLLAITFPAEWLRRYGPRGFGVGMMALLSAFFALWVQVTPAQVPGGLLAIAIGGATAWIVYFVVVTDSPQLVLRSARIALRARLRLLTARAPAARADDADARRALRDEVIALDRAVLGVDRILAAPTLALDEDTRRATRRALLDAQLAADEFVELAVRGASTDRAAGVLAEADARASDLLDRAAQARATGRADAPIAPGPRPPALGGLEPTTRIALQVTVAAVAAMALGFAIPPHEPYWGVLTAFMVANQVASSGETRRRAIARVAGTVAGVAAGTALVTLVHGRHPLEVGLIVAFACIGLYAFRWRYWLFVFCLTGLIAMAYDLVGRPADQLLLGRLVETAIGGLCGGLSATFLVPLRTRAVVAATARGFVDALHESMRASVAALRGGAADPLEAARSLDGHLGELLDRMRPLAEGPRRDVSTAATQRTMITLADSAYRARELAREALRGRGDDTAVAELRAIVADMTRLATSDGGVLTPPG